MNDPRTCKHIWEPLSGTPDDSWWRCTQCVARQQRARLQVEGVRFAYDIDPGDWPGVPTP